MNVGNEWNGKLQFGRLSKSSFEGRIWSEGGGGYLLCDSNIDIPTVTMEE